MVGQAAAPLPDHLQLGRKWGIPAGSNTAMPSAPGGEPGVERRHPRRDHAAQWSTGDGAIELSRD